MGKNPLWLHANQKLNAMNVLNLMKDDVRCVSVAKKPQVGFTGFCVALAYYCLVHGLVKNVVFLTSMSDCKALESLKRALPKILRDRVYHLPTLGNAEPSLSGVETLAMIDENDVGSKKKQKMDTLLRKTGFLDINNMKEKNNYLVTCSATSIKQQCDLEEWGPSHENYVLQPPPGYIGYDILNARKVYRPYYSMADGGAQKLCDEIIGYHRLGVHICRVPLKLEHVLETCAKERGITVIKYDQKHDIYKNGDYEKAFVEPLVGQVLIIVKRMWSRANSWDTKMKLRIGILMVQHTNNPDDNRINQDLTSRYYGTWALPDDHKVGPHYTNITSLVNYNRYINGLEGSYRTRGFMKTEKGYVRNDPMGMYKDVPGSLEPESIFSKYGCLRYYKLFDTEYELNVFTALLCSDNVTPTGRSGTTKDADFTLDAEGFKICSTGSTKRHSLEELLEFAEGKGDSPCSNLPKSCNDLRLNEITHRKYVAYKDINDTTTAVYVAVWSQRLRAAKRAREEGEA